MKLKHFFFKPDGLYYIANMPKEPEYGNPNIAHGKDISIEWKNYYDAVDQAKENATKVDIESSKYIRKLIRDEYGIDYDPINYEIHAILMEEEIEIVGYSCNECRGDDEIPCPLVDEYDEGYCCEREDKIARIAIKQDLEKSPKAWSISKMFGKEVIMYEGVISSITFDELVDKLNELEEIKRKLK